MEAILVTTTEGHMRLGRSRERSARFAEKPRVMESPRKRHRPEGEGSSLLRHQHSEALISGVHKESGGTSCCSTLPASVPLAKRSWEQETDMTDASVEQGERKRCKEQPTANLNRHRNGISGCVHDSFLDLSRQNVAVEVDQ